jgi:hypothetical protein
MPIAIARQATGGEQRHAVAARSRTASPSSLHRLLRHRDQHHDRRGRGTLDGDVFVDGLVARVAAIRKPQ